MTKAIDVGKKIHLAYGWTVTVQTAPAGYVKGNC